MISKKLFLSVAGALAVVGAVGSHHLAAHFSRPDHMSHFQWAFVGDSLSALAGHADVIVVARAKSTAPSRVVFSDGGEDPLPFEFIELDVLRGVKGASEGESLFVERAGGTDPITGRVANIDADGGDFHLGETYLLFLKAQAGSTGAYYQVNDQSRYSVRGSTVLSIMEEPDAVASSLDGKSVLQAIVAIQTALQ